MCLCAVAEKTTGAMGNIVAATGLVKKDEFPADMNVSPAHLCSQKKGDLVINQSFGFNHHLKHLLITFLQGFS